MKLNIGCGENKLDGFVNIDIEESVKPDMVLDLRKVAFPYMEESIEHINCTHNIEHIEMRFWPQIIIEFNRVLKPDGILTLAYPEFSKCAQNFIENKMGMRDFWRATLYGRQLYAGDYHVVPMVSEDLMHLLYDLGFKDIKYTPEIGQEFNTFMIAYKDGSRKPNRTHEDVVNEVVFGNV